MSDDSRSGPSPVTRRSRWSNRLGVLLGDFGRILDTRFGQFDGE
jgi:hypothetical protein